MIAVPAARQTDFAAALLDPTRPVPCGITGPDHKPTTRRFNVYRNNVIASLTRVLRAAFPAVHRIVGEECFAALCGEFIRSEPPKSPLLFDYGDSFPDFLHRFEPLASLPYLRDVARIERAWVQAYHAADAQSLHPAAFAKLSPQDLPAARVALHPSLRVIDSHFPAFSIWKMNIDRDTTSVNLDAGGEDVLINRPNAEVELHLLPPAGAAFLQALAQGRTLLDATESALAADDGFDLPGNLSGLMAAGVFTGIGASCSKN